ncbi:MAG TPA: hypothetical protein VJB14_07185 [Planctomycetota bacterium]|nr:hypothetical protein [Planctomycetota bacterium]
MSGPTLGQILDRIRALYIEHLDAALTEAMKGPGSRVNVEPVYRTKTGLVAREGALSLPLRGDLFDGANMVRVDSARRISFEPFEFKWAGSLQVRMEPFFWDSCPLRLEGPSPAWTPLTDWFDRWFDGEEKRAPAYDGFYGVIHFLADPAPSGAAFLSSVDFGSAPVEAFEQLLDAVRALGLRKLHIGGGKP